MIAFISLVVSLVAIVLVVRLSKAVHSNSARSLQNSTLINENRNLISQNSKLIFLLQLLINMSNVQTDWTAYKEAAKRYGIDLDDPLRNLDITDPEG